MVELRPLTPETFERVIRLTVNEAQKEFVATNLYSIAQAYVEKDAWTIRIIYADGAPVGFMMYGIYPGDGSPGLSRLMVDEAHQHRGYGRAALRLALPELRRLVPGKAPALAVDPGNTAAIALYQSEGFAATGEKWGHESIMEYTG